MSIAASRKGTRRGIVDVTDPDRALAAVRQALAVRGRSAA